MSPGMRVKRAVWPVFVLSLLLMAALACNLTGGDKKQKATKSAVGGAPSAVINAPDNNAQVLRDNDVRIFANASDAQGVTHVELLADNFVVASQASPNQATGGDKEFEVLFRWRPTTTGPHTLEVVPWRGTVRGKSTRITIIVRDRASQITQTPATLLPFVTATAITAYDPTCRAEIQWERSMCAPGRA